MKKTFISLMLSLFATAPALAVQTPADVVNDFYKLRIAKATKGAPSGMELGDYSNYLAPELVCRLGASLRYSEQLSKNVPDAKLPFADLDLYANRNDSPTSFEVGKSQLSGSSGRIPVHLSNDSASWENVVHVKMMKHHWVIDDIDYADKAGSLVDKLDETLSHPVAESHWDSKELESCTLPQVSARSSRHGAKGRHHGKGSRAKAASSKGKSSSHAARSKASTGKKAAHSAAKSKSSATSKKAKKGSKH